ncbi:MAG: branched-chain amino acid ABC transporter ATP-binding protein/permease [Rubrivivax sp.]
MRLRPSWLRPSWLVAAGVVALAAAFWLLPEFDITLLCGIGLAALVAVGLVLLTGVGGMTSFGQAAFVGIGAYATAWLCTSPLVKNALGEAAATSSWLPWAGLLLGLLVTAAVAGLLGAVTVRLSGHYLPLGTIAWGLALYYLFGNLDILNGHTGITGIPDLQIGPLSLADPRAIGALIWALLLGSLWALFNLLDSAQGRAIRALKSSRLMAESMGVDTGRQRLKLFVLAALLAALSGWLYAHFQRFVNPTPFNLNTGIEYLFMAVIGGAGHLWGALVGAATIVLLKEQLQDVLPALLGTAGNFEGVVFGLLMLLVLQRFAGGLWPAVTWFAQRVLRLRVRPPAVSASAPRSPSPSPSPSTPTSTQRLPRASVPAVGAVLLQAHSVSKRFGGLLANDRITMELRAGEVHALIGPNGAGKSTLFNMVSGVDDPSDGSVHLLGREMTRRPARDHARHGLGRTFQHVRLLGQRSVLENVALGAHRHVQSGWLRSMLRLDRAEEAALLATARIQIERCGLLEHIDAEAASLSLGQQRIVEIARALAGQPSMLLLDEPAAGLRHLEKTALAALLRQLRAEGLGILVVEHDMGFVMDLADRITVLDFGSVIARGTPAAIQADAKVQEAYLGGAEDDAPQVAAGAEA